MEPQKKNYFRKNSIRKMQKDIFTFEPVIRLREKKNIFILKLSRKGSGGEGRGFMNLF